MPRVSQRITVPGRKNVPCSKVVQDLLAFMSLNSWEEEFLNSLNGLIKSKVHLSEKQIAVISGMYRKFIASRQPQ